MTGLTILNLSPMSNRNFKQMVPRTAELIKKGVYNPGALVTDVADYHNAQDIFVKSLERPKDFIKGVITF